jgi:hypothetical protein
MRQRFHQTVRCSRGRGADQHGFNPLLKYKQITLYRDINMPSRSSVVNVVVLHRPFTHCVLAPPRVAP